MLAIDSFPACVNDRPVRAGVAKIQATADQSDVPCFCLQDSTLGALFPDRADAWGADLAWSLYDKLNAQEERFNEALYGFTERRACLPIFDREGRQDDTLINGDFAAQDITCQLFFEQRFWCEFPADFKGIGHAVLVMVNAPDDRAVARQFSIKTRPINRFSPLD